MKFVGMLTHDEIVQALSEFVQRNRPSMGIEPKCIQVSRDGNGHLACSFEFDLAPSKAQFGGKTTCSHCHESGHNAATCWRNGPLSGNGA